MTLEDALTDLYTNVDSEYKHAQSRYNTQNVRYFLDVSVVKTLDDAHHLILTKRLKFYAKVLGIGRSARHFHEEFFNAAQINAYITATFTIPYKRFDWQIH